MLRAVGLRVLLVLGGLAVVVSAVAVAEAVLALAGAGESRAHDPFVGFANLVPMFEREVDADGRAWMRTARARATKHRDAFAARKSPDAFRVFVVGGSSAAGVPYGYPWAFAAWLERKLAVELPQREVEVVNAAVSGYASRRVLAVVEELAAYEPDLLVVYAGHNEMLERRYYAHLLDLDPTLFRAWRALAGTRLYAVLSDRFGIDRRAKPADVAFDDFNALEEMFSVYSERLSGGGATAARRDRAYTELHFEHNVARMIETMQRAGADVALVSVAQNLADWAPGGSRHDETLGEAELAAFSRALSEGDRLQGASCVEARTAWQRAGAIDDEVAELHYRLAGCARRLGEYDLARHHYQRASDLDVIPHGASSHLNRILRERASESGALFIDVAGHLAAVSEHGLVGDRHFNDHVHPRLHTHIEIAATIGEALRRNGIPEPSDRWRAERWSAPDAESILMADPALRAQEHLVRALACALAMRPACVETETRATLALDPENAQARVVGQVMRRVEDARRSAEP